MPTLIAEGQTGTTGTFIVTTWFLKTASGQTGSEGLAGAPNLAHPELASGSTGSTGVALLSFVPFSTSTPVIPSTPVGVLPQFGGNGAAIFTGWMAAKARSIVGHEHWDRHSAGRARHPALRHKWDVKVECDEPTAQAIWAFILSHLGAGISFYFYDLEQPGVVYDPTGILTNGRYSVRFLQDVFPRRYRKGTRYTFDFGLIEIDDQPVVIHQSYTISTSLAARAALALSEAFTASPFINISATLGARAAVSVSEAHTSVPQTYTEILALSARTAAGIGDAHITTGPQTYTINTTLGGKAGL